MCSHAKVLWSWGAGNWDPTIHLAGHFSFSNAFSTSFREDSWQEEEFKMFAQAAIPIKAWLLDAAAFVETIFRNEKKEEEKWRKSGKDFFYIVLSFYNYYLQKIGIFLLDLHHEMQILVLYVCKISSNDAHFLSMYLKRK